MSVYRLGLMTPENKMTSSKTISSSSYLDKNALMNQIETKYECSPFLEIFSGDSIVRPSHPEAQVVRTLSTHGHRDWVQDWSVTEPSSCCWPNSWHNSPQHSEKLRLLSVIIQTLSLNDLMAPTGVTRRLASGVRTNWNWEWVNSPFFIFIRGVLIRGSFHSEAQVVRH